jgi:hypothetical protein
MAERITSKELPTILYKYRDESNLQFQHKIISHQEIYLSKPSQYNDPFDCKIPVRWDLLTEQERNEANLKMIRIVRHDESEDVIHQIAQHLKDTKQIWFDDRTNRREDKSDFKKWDDVAGVFSLSEVNNNILMWSHYANQHKGFAVGIWSESIIEKEEFRYLDSVNYVDEFPLIKGVEDQSEQFYKKFYYKSNDWQYEKEWRIVSLHPKNRAITIPKSAMAEIIFGSHMDERIQEKMLKQINKILPDVKLYKAEDSRDKFAVNIKPLK